MEAEDKKAEREFRLRQMEMEKRREEQESQDRQSKMEFDLRMKELDMQGERQRLEHEIHMAQSDTGWMAGASEMDREHHEGADDIDGEPVEPRLVSRVPTPW